VDAAIALITERGVRDFSLAIIEGRKALHGTDWPEGSTGRKPEG